MTVTVTANITDVGGRPDRTQWVFTSVIRGETGQIITTAAVYAKPEQDGSLTVELEPGYCQATYGGAGSRTQYTFEVPDHDADLWDLIAAGVGAPPGTSADALQAAIATYFSTHGDYVTTAEMNTAITAAINSLRAPEVVSAGTWSGVNSAEALSVPAPSGLGDADLIFVYVFSTSQSATPTTEGLTGLTGNPFSTSGTADDSDIRWYVFASAPQSGTYDFTISGGGRTRFGFAVRLRNVSPTDLFDGSPVTSSTDSTTTSPVSLTTAADNELLLWASFNLGDSASHTVPAGFTEVSGSTDQTSGASDGGNYMIAAKHQATAGPTGDVSGTWDNANNIGAWMVALKPRA